MPGKLEPVVVNTGPLLALGACGQLDLLSRLHGPVFTPEIVVIELARVTGQGRAPTAPSLPPSWLQVVPLEHSPAPFLQAYLDDGEAAVIALAQQLDVRLIVMDERRGRLTARTAGFSVTGSVGILLRAKRQGLLDVVKPCLDRMQAAGVWLGQELVRLTLKEAGE